MLKSLIQDNHSIKSIVYLDMQSFYLKKKKTSFNRLADVAIYNAVGESSLTIISPCSKIVFIGNSGDKTESGIINALFQFSILISLDWSVLSLVELIVEMKLFCNSFPKIQKSQ